MELTKFKGGLKNNTCPFCGKPLKYYDGALGYEANRCYDCGLISDHNGLSFEVV